MQFVLQNKSWLPQAQCNSSGVESAVHVIFGAAGERCNRCWRRNEGTNDCLHGLQKEASDKDSFLTVANSQQGIDKEPNSEVLGYFSYRRRHTDALEQPIQIFTCILIN